MQAPSLFVRRLFMVGGLLAGASAVQAMPLFLGDNNATALIDTQTQAGQFNWMVDGVNHLNKQWFWYRTDAMPQEMSIDTLTQIGAITTDTNPFVDARPDTLDVLYSDPAQRFHIEVGLHLRGGLANSGKSDLAEQISIRNLTNAPLTFHFFQYVDFDLDGSPLGDEINFPADNTVVQQKAGGSWVAETVITPRSSHHETHLVPITLDKLNDGLPTTLDDANVEGPGNVAWAFEWDVVIPAGGEFQISKDKQIVPDVSTLAMLTLSGIPLIRRRRRA
jgi:hypothetical protein